MEKCSESEFYCKAYLSQRMQLHDSLSQLDGRLFTCTFGHRIRRITVVSLVPVSDQSLNSDGWAVIVHHEGPFILKFNCVIRAFTRACITEPLDGHSVPYYAY